MKKYNYYWAMKYYFPKSQLIAIGIVGIPCHSTYVNTNIKNIEV